MSARLAYRLARISGVTALARAWRPGAVVLCYHNVVDGPVAVPDPGLHLPVDEFRWQLRWLLRHFRVVSLDELHARATRGEVLRGLAAITFDDAYEGTLAHALPVLQEAGVPSTVFVPTGAPSGALDFWWDRAGAAAAADATVRARWIETYAGDASRIAPELAAPVALPAQCRPASWARLRAARGPLLTYGAHTVMHRTLPRLDDAELGAELREAAAALRAEVDEAARWLASPYGRWDARVAAAARAAGYVGGWTLGARDVTPGTDWSAAPRVNIPAGLPPEVFESWVSGLAHLRAAA